MRKFIVSILMLTSFGAFAKEQVPFSLYCPEQNVSSTFAYICWDSLKNRSSKVTDYIIYLNGEKLNETAKQQSSVSNPDVAAYRSAFYSHYTKKLTGIEMQDVDVTFYTLNHLAADTQYKVRLDAVNKKGKTLFSSEEISFRTKPCNSLIDVTDYGAVTGDKIVNLDASDSEKAMILANTKAIQKAIDECPENGTVYIPNGIFMSGGLNLKSNMTLKIDGTLCSSPFAQHYRFGFLMYSYYTDKRYFGLLNADGAKNLVITGSGCIDGNGWLFADANRRPSATYQVYSEEGDVDFSKVKVRARKLVQYAKGNNTKVYECGILAKNCAQTYLSSIGKTSDTAEKSELAEAYSTRSTTVILKNVENLLISDLLFVNPANHMINIIDSKNITVTGITELTYDANNGDGVGLICSTDALIFNNFIDTGDDSIVFSAGVGKPAATTGQTFAGNTKIFGNYIHHGHGGVAFGSHTALGLRNIHVHDNIFNHTDAPFRIKSAPANGGEVCGIVFEKNAIACAKQPFIMSTEYNDAGTVTKYGAADTPAVFHDILCQDCTVYKVSGTTFYVSAKNGQKHHDILIKNIRFSKPGNLGRYIQNADVKFENVR